MKKGTVKIAGIIGVLIVVLLIFGWLFGGGLQHGFKVVTDPINSVWQSITGDDSSKIIDENPFDEDHSGFDEDIHGTP